MVPRIYDAAGRNSSMRAAEKRHKMNHSAWFIRNHDDPLRVREGTPNV
jgi:hypothetical protein